MYVPLKTISLRLMTILPGGKFSPLKIISELRLSEETMPEKY